MTCSLFPFSLKLSVLLKISVDQILFSYTNIHLTVYYCFVTQILEKIYHYCKYKIKFVILLIKKSYKTFTSVI